jgi:hypothetical protein
VTSSFQIARGYPDYFGLVDQVTSMVTAVVPPAATVLMVSKGDENLLTLGSRKGWHFPRQEDGRYAGYYPTDSQDAIRQLEDLRKRGAGYLVFPLTSLWWLEHYPELNRHLQQRYTCMVRDDDVCAIYELTEKPAAQRETAAAGDTREAVPTEVEAAPDPARRLALNVGQLVSFVDSILPPVTPVAVLTSGDERVMQLTGREVWHFPHDKSGRFAAVDSWEAALDQLEILRGRGLEFLVVPRETPWLAHHPEFLDQVEERYRCVARQRYLCTVYDLNEAPPERRAPAPGDEPAPRRRWLRT